jgi:excisionase family DNA binding protein
MENEYAKLESIKETAAWTGLSVGWWYAAVAAKRVPYYKLSHSVRFRRAEIEAWLAAQHRDPQPVPEHARAKNQKRKTENQKPKTKTEK